MSGALAGVSTPENFFCVFFCRVPQAGPVLSEAVANFI
jgi:hypothetical protein